MATRQNHPKPASLAAALEAGEACWICGLLFGGEFDPDHDACWMPEFETQTGATDREREMGSPPEFAG